MEFLKDLNDKQKELLIATLNCVIIDDQVYIENKGILNSNNENAIKVEEALEKLIELLEGNKDV